MGDERGTYAPRALIMARALKMAAEQDEDAFLMACAEQWERAALRAIRRKQVYVTKLDWMQLSLPFPEPDDPPPFQLSR